MTTMLINIEQETKSQLTKEAKKQGISVAALTRQLLVRGLVSKPTLSKYPLSKAKGRIKASDLKNIEDATHLSTNIDSILYG